MATNAEKLEATISAASSDQTSDAFRKAIDARNAYTRFQEGTLSLTEAKRLIADNGDQRFARWDGEE